MIKIKTALVLASIATATAATAAQAQTNLPTLTVVTPSEGQTIYGDRIPILISAENFEVVDFAQNPRAIRGQGHVHLWLDDQNPTRESAVKLTSDTFTYADVAYGNHTLKAELVNNDHTSLSPLVVTTINFKSAPTSTPSPAPVSGFDKNTALVILVVVALVIIAAWWYTKEEVETPKSSQTPKKTVKRTSRRKKK